MKTVETTTARGRRTRDAILAAAADLFHRRGVHATGVEDVLEASGTGKGQLYHFFGSKDALVRAVLRDMADRYFESYAEQLGALDSWDGIRAWFDSIVAMHEQWGCPGCPFGMLASELSDLDPLLRGELDGFFGRLRGHLARGLDAMRAAGRLRPEADPEAMAVLALSALQGGALLAKIRKEVGPLRVVADELMRSFRSLETPAPPRRRRG